MPTIHLDTYDGENHGAPKVPVTIDTRNASGLDIMLGTESSEEYSKPLVFVERRLSGWCVIVSSNGYADPDLVLYITDSGRLVGDTDSVNRLPRAVGANRFVDLMPWHTERVELEKKIK